MWFAHIFTIKNRSTLLFLNLKKRNGASYYLLTAYYLNKEYGVKQIENKLKKRLDEVL